MSASAGRVLLIPKGTYAAGTTYNMLDTVYYEGSTYVCKQTSVGHLPTDTTYWQIMAQGSAGTASGGGYCGSSTTAAATAAKVVTVPAEDNFELKTGVIVMVHWLNTNSAYNPTMNVNNTGAKSIHFKGAALGESNLWVAGEMSCESYYMYDGTYWQWIGHNSGREAAKEDLASIITTGSTNTTGATIVAGTYFYLNGVFVKALADIASGSTYTIGTNVAQTTVGDEISGLVVTLTGTTVSDLNAAINALSNEEYYYSKLILNNGYLLTPDYATKEYSAFVPVSSASANYTTRVYAVANGYVINTKPFNGDMTTQAATVSSWKLIYIKR